MTMQSKKGSASADSCRIISFVAHGAAMRLFLRMIVIVAAVASAGSHSAPAWQQEKEGLAAAALVDAGVPLQRDPLGRVRWIEAGNGELTDDAMRHVAGLPYLEWLEVVTKGALRMQETAGLRQIYLDDNMGKDWQSQATLLLERYYDRN